MADLPILFSGAMVRGLLREIQQPGTGKTQTRRVLKAPVGVLLSASRDPDGRWHCVFDQEASAMTGCDFFPPRYAVGDRLYVREAWRTHRYYDDLSPSEMGGEESIVFEADHPPLDRRPHRLADGRTRQGMHMPRWASRVTLIVTDVRVQRLQEISGVDCIAEGAPIDPDYRDTTADQSSPPMVKVNGWTWQTPRAWYHELWDSLNDSRGYGWDANPWVAAYSFRPVAGNIDQIAEAA